MSFCATPRYGGGWGQNLTVSSDLSSKFFVEQPFSLNWPSGTAYAILLFNHTGSHW